MDLVQNMFLGAAYGDAAGAPYEVFGSRSVRGADAPQYEGKFVLGRTFTDRYRKTSVTYEPGYVTDDSSMLFAAREIVESGWTDEKAILGYQRWAAGPFGRFMGKNTRLLFANVRTVSGYMARLRKHDGPNAQSNGCLMRTAAFATYPTLPHCIEYARSDCRITNPNMESMVCCEIQVTMLFLALNKWNALEIWETICGRYSNHPTVRSVVDGPLDTINFGTYNPMRDDTKGWCVVALFCSVWALRRAAERHDLEETLTMVVRGSLDSDTTGSIVGQLTGALGCEFNEENVEIMAGLNPWVLD